MPIMKTIAIENLNQIKDLLHRISKRNYNEKSEVLSGASIGQHIRHILEFYILFVSGSVTGVINYDKRKRDIQLETEPAYALSVIKNISDSLYALELNKAVSFESEFTKDDSKNSHIASSSSRELAYCIEHSIHHMALIKAGLIDLGLHDHTTRDFGVAYSTLRYRNTTCVQ